jgi:hypothetical protein
VKRERMKELEEELRLIAESYNVDHMAVCATDQTDGSYVGFIVGKHNMLTMHETVLNIGRLWQYGRELVRQSLDNFEIKRRW